MEPSISYRYKESQLRVQVGDDALTELERVMDREGATNGFVICGNTVAHQTELLDRIEAILGDSYAGFYDGVEPESPYSSIVEGVAAVEAADADLLIAVGGGSTVVTTRAISIFEAEDGDPHEYCTQYPEDGPPVSPRLNEPKLPNVVVLTTPTTATNRAGTAVKDEAETRRLEFFDPKTTPRAVFIDSGALMTAPVNLYKNTAASTFCGVIDSLQTPSLTTMSRGDLETALTLSTTYIPAIDDQPDNPTPRIHLAEAALLSNRASQARTSAGGTGSIQSGIVHQIQILYDSVHQGRANCATTIPALEFNREVLLEEQAAIADAWGITTTDQSPEEKAKALTDEIESFLSANGLPTDLEALGIPKDDIPEIAEKAMQDYFLQTNPREVTDTAQLEALLESAW